MAYPIAAALLILLLVCIGVVHLYLCREEIFGYDRQRIPRQTEAERKAMYQALGMAALGGGAAAGILVLLLKM
jgi:hypothetical protein